MTITGGHLLCYLCLQDHDGLLTFEPSLMIFDAVYVDILQNLHILRSLQGGLLMYYGYGSGYYGVGYDPLMLLVIPFFIFSLWAQYRVNAIFKRYSAVSSQKGISAARVAEDILRDNGITDVKIQRIAGHLTDNYNPKTNELSLSESVYDSSSLSALGVAAHEVGHVLQHYEMYAPLRLRSMFVPIAQIGSYAAVPLFLLGLMVSITPLMWLGIIVFAAVVLFYFVTLPVEFNASSRAIEALEAGGHLYYEEARPARKVLNAAGLTYIAAALQALLQLVRLLLMSSRRRK